jgi:hypothetical protein
VTAIAQTAPRWRRTEAFPLKIAGYRLQGIQDMRVTHIARVLVMAGIAVAVAACASHHADSCRNPAKVVGGPPAAKQSGWVMVRDDRSVSDTAERIAKDYHVRTQPLTYVHGFSTYPVPNEPKFLCDKAVAEVHYDRSNVAAR